MKYKGKKVNKHRYKQLVKARDNHRKIIEDMNKMLLHPKSLERLKEFMKEA